MCIFIVSYVILFWWYYCRGMAEYFKLNRKQNKSDELQVIGSALKDELDELFIEIKAFNLISILMEFNDVIHAIIKYTLILLLPLKWLESPYIWVTVFWLAPLTTWKHGYRYLEHNCIRNHKNINNCNHVCKYYTIK